MIYTMITETPLRHALLGCLSGYDTMITLAERNDH